jgi:hypothetical protein
VPTEQGLAGAPPSIEWVLRGVSDLDGNQTLDLLWHNLTTGQVAVWKRDAQHNVVATAITTTISPDLDWVATVQMSAGDRPMMLTQHTKQKNVVGYVLGTDGMVQQQIEFGVSDPNSTLIGMGTFSDRKPAILMLENATGRIWYQRVDASGNAYEVVTLGTLPAGWKLIGTGRL